MDCSLRPNWSKQRGYSQSSKKKRIQNKCNIVMVWMCLPEFQVTELLVVRKEADVLFT